MSPETHFQPMIITPIQIRENLTVRIATLPFDLTEAEAKKIAAVVMAHVRPSEQGK